jgi:NAD(P)-dependent dehydrogenase (short-subunit alcohol dehydrogenase family)
MREPGSGRILLISRAAAFTGGIADPHHAASKAGLHALTHFPASRLAATGITVNAQRRRWPPRPGCCPATRPSRAAGARWQARRHPRSPASPRPSSPRPTDQPGHLPRRRHLPQTGTGRHSPQRADVQARLPPTSALP